MDAMSDPMSSTETEAGEPNGKLKRKEYEQELARLQIDLGRAPPDFPGEQVHF